MPSTSLDRAAGVLPKPLAGGSSPRSVNLPARIKSTRDRFKAGTPGATTMVSIALELPAAPAIATPMAAGCIPPASILESVVEAGVVIAPWTGSPAVPAEDGCRGVELVLGKLPSPKLPKVPLVGMVPSPPALAPTGWE